MKNSSIAYDSLPLKKLFFFTFFLVYTLSVFAQLETPILNKIVTDNASIFTDAEENSLTQKLTDFETKTTTQIVVLTINSLQGETIEGYALDVFNKNKLGQKNVDNGILILFSNFDRDVRIEVGYGLEAIITDALASRIIRQIMIPRFKEQQYFEGINEATSKIIELINNPELIEEFLAKKENNVSILGRLFGSTIMTPIFFLLFIYGYNKTIARNNKKKKIRVKKIYNTNQNYFFGVLLSAILIVAFFIFFFFKVFAVLFFIGFFALFIFAGVFIFINFAFKELVKTFENILTGELGVFILPFMLIATLPASFGGLALTLLSLIFLIICLEEVVFDFNFQGLISDFKWVHLLYFFIAFLIIVYIITIIIAVLKIKKEGKSFGFSFFKISTKFKSILSRKNRRSSSRSSTRGSKYSGRTYSSSSSYSSSDSYSSSSSDDFSGGGGSSGGGGASGSW